MYLEYTPEFSGDAFADIKNALRERPDNLLTEDLSSEQLNAVDRLLAGPLVHLNQYLLLNEMAGLVTKFWAKGENLPIYFMGGTSDIQAKVLQYAQEWSHYCSITFSATNNIRASKLRVSFQNTGSWSHIGTNAKGIPRGQATINFGWLSATLPERDFKQVVLHEFGHALGLIHEHQSPTAVVQWNKPYIYNVCRIQLGWDKAKVDLNIIDQFETTSTQYSALDKLSIMGYYIPPEFTLNNESFPKNYELSAVDQSFIGQIYP